MFSAYTVAECSPIPVEANLSEWERDNYKKVTIETQKYMGACIMELNNQLPRLLKKQHMYQNSPGFKTGMLSV